MSSSTVHTTWWYKDFFTKFSYIFTGIILLVMINMALWVMIQAQELLWPYIILVALFAWMFWRMWRLLSRMRYEFSPERVLIHLPGRKTYDLAVADMEWVIYRDSLPWWYGWWIKIIPWTREVAFTTSTTHTMTLVMKDGRRIVLTPRIYPPRDWYSVLDTDQEQAW